MAGMDLQALKRYRDRGDPPASVFVESGTYHGATARRALSLFASVHTIELSESLAAEYHPTLAAMGINCYLGDSAEIVFRLADQIDEPVCWYLDAHFAPALVGTARGALPLELELEAISGRDFPDVVIVDDVHAFGSSLQPEWGAVDLDWILSFFPRPRFAAISGDQAVLAR